MSSKLEIRYLCAGVVLLILLDSGLFAQNSPTIRPREGITAIDKNGAVYTAITYHGLLKNRDRALVTNADVNIIFRIYDSFEYGNLIWKSEKAVQTDGQGRFTVILNCPNLKPDRNYYLSLQVFGDNEEMSPRQPINLSEKVNRGSDIGGDNLPDPLHVGEHWTDELNRVLYTNDAWGLARGGFSNSLIGAKAYTMINLGGNSTTGALMFNYEYSSVLGGYKNTAGSDYALVAGGQSNNATGMYSVVIGGLNNTASGKVSVIPGGDHNSAAGDYSFAAGRQAVADFDGSFVWADATDAPFAATAANQFLIRAFGGVGFGTTDASDRFVISRDGISKDFVVDYTNGNVGIGTDSPDAKLHVASNGIQVGSSTGLYSELVNNNVIFHRDDGASYVSQHGNGSLGFVTNNDYTTIRMLIDKVGKVGIGTWNPQAKLHVAGSDDTDAVTQISVKSEKDAIFRMHDYEDTRPINDPNPTEPCQYFDIAYSSSDLKLHFRGGYYHYFNIGEDIMTLVDDAEGNVGIGTSTPGAKLDIKGGMIVGGIKPDLTGVDGFISIRNENNDEVARIGAGFDYAETFSTNYDKLEAGTVMIIDRENPGNLCVSNKPYDKKVAGIVAGANGLSSGVMLGQAGIDGEHPIALAGRVYCKVDATYGAIEPGDLLTTSPTPGHAMVIRDRDEAQGAIIGKAMQALPEGESGKILVLVTLQ